MLFLDFLDGTGHILERAQMPGNDWVEAMDHGKLALKNPGLRSWSTDQQASIVGFEVRTPEGKLLYTSASEP